jgi:hypothetical protein
MKIKNLEEFLINNQGLSNKELVAKTGWSERQIRKVKAKLGISNPQPNQGGNNMTMEQRVHKHLLSCKKKAISVGELSDVFDCGVSKIKDIIAGLHKKGINILITDGGVEISKDIPKAEPTTIPFPKGNVIRFGYVTDNHLCSRYERLDVLNTLYDVFAKEGITTVFNTGNIIDGEARFNKHDLHTSGLDGQTNYLIKVYPQREGITTHFITGDDHEGWYTQREGIDTGKHMQNVANNAGRKDLVYLGHMEHDVIVPAKKGQTIIRLQHPGGGSSYAISYTSQKIVESLSGGEKPHILLIGHYHKAAYNFIRNIHVIQGGCTEDQTPFMRKKRLSAHLGGWICEATVNDKGDVIRFKQEFIPFFDKDAYKWTYKF